MPPLHTHPHTHPHWHVHTSTPTLTHTSTYKHPHIHSHTHKPTHIHTEWEILTITTHQNSVNVRALCPAADVCRHSPNPSTHTPADTPPSTHTHTHTHTHTQCERDSNNDNLPKQRWHQPLCPAAVVWHQFAGQEQPHGEGCSVSVSVTHSSVYKYI